MMCSVLTKDILIQEDCWHDFFNVLCGSRVEAAEQ